MKYAVHSWSRKGMIVKYCVCDAENYPEDPENYLRDCHEWYRKEMLASFDIVAFPVHARQSENEAKARAEAYADFANRQYEAAARASESVTM